LYQQQLTGAGEQLVSSAARDVQRHVVAVFCAQRPGLQVRVHPVEQRVDQLRRVELQLVRLAQVLQQQEEALVVDVVGGLLGIGGDIGKIVEVETSLQVLDTHAEGRALKGRQHDGLRPVILR